MVTRKNIIPSEELDNTYDWNFQEGRRYPLRTPQGEIVLAHCVGRQSGKMSFLVEDGEIVIRYLTPPKPQTYTPPEETPYKKAVYTTANGLRLDSIHSQHLLRIMERSRNTPVDGEIDRRRFEEAIELFPSPHNRPALNEEDFNPEDRMQRNKRISTRFYEELKPTFTQEPGDEERPTRAERDITSFDYSTACDLVLAHLNLFRLNQIGLRRDETRPLVPTITQLSTLILVEQTGGIARVGEYLLEEYAEGQKDLMYAIFTPQLTIHNRKSLLNSLVERLRI